MTNVTQIHDTHAEYLQLLKYEEGQFYKTHHDYIPMQKMRVQGSRILTVFLYLNDVEEGENSNADITRMYDLVAFYIKLSYCFLFSNFKRRWHQFS